MKKKLYKQNKKHLPDKINNLIKKTNFFRDLKPIETKSDNLTCKVKLSTNKKKLIHSSYDPVREARKFIDNINLKQVDIFILAGFGLGYHIKELLNNLSSNQVIKIIILNPDVFKFAVENRDLRDVLKGHRIELIISSDFKDLCYKLNKLFASIPIKNSKLLIHSSSLAVVPEKFIELKDILEKIKVNRQNNLDQKDQIIRNITNNLKYLNKSINISLFRNSFNNSPIFIVSAGPSLDKNINQLKKINNRGIIISVDTALTSLLDKGIEPDFVVAIDSTENIYNNIFKKISKDISIPLIYSLGVYDKVIKNYSGPKIVGLAKKDRLADQLGEFTNIGRVETRGSVASTALDFAVKAGGDPIVFVGQDFAFSKEGVTHAEKSYYNIKKDTSLLRQIPGVKREKVYTSVSYYLYLKCFERYIEKNSAPIYIDASEGGAKIAGTKVMNLEKTIKEYCQATTNKFAIINNLIEKPLYKTEEIDSNKLVDYIKELD